MFGDAAEAEDRHALSGEELLVEADIALYDAKEAGRDRVAMYDAAKDRHKRMEARLTWADRIRRAIEHESFILHAQPILGLNGDTAARHELLIRMVGDEGDLIPPGTFLYIAERFDLIQDIDRWVMRQAIRLLAEHKRAGRTLNLQVNVSAKSVAAPDFPRFIEAELEDAAIDGRGLCVEITETAAIVNVDSAKRFAEQLRELGGELALDDFGAGFASFYYLKHLTFDYVKIDGEFIKDLTSSPINQYIVKAIVAIARGIGKRTIAEFVGDEKTLKMLERHGVHYAQGFHIGKPTALNGNLLDAARAPRRDRVS
jgi:EAL domain-containing protein (putative c-di-GMP-specific phosphodiesterase class I)